MVHTFLHFQKHGLMTILVGSFLNTLVSNNRDTSVAHFSNTDLNFAQCVSRYYISEQLCHIELLFWEYLIKTHTTYLKTSRQSCWLKAPPPTICATLSDFRKTCKYDSMHSLKASSFGIWVSPRRKLWKYNINANLFWIMHPTT